MKRKTIERECLANAEIVSTCAKKFGIGQWSFIGPGSDKKWFSMEENRGKDAGGIRGEWMSNFPCNCKSAQSLRSSRKHV